MKKFKNIADLAERLGGVINTIALGIFDLSDKSDGSDGSDVSDSVERDASGVPTAWRLFKLGNNEITRNGETFTLEFTGEMFDAIVAYFAEKGTKIPLDSEHFLYNLAEKLGVPESEILNLIPGGRGTFGFGALEKRADGLWIANVEYVPLARDLMAQKIYRWFSPVLRGLVDGRLRVTSVAFQNQPALNNLDAIAATAESSEIKAGEGLLSLSSEINKLITKKETRVKSILTAIAGLLGMDSLSLGADGSAPQGVVEKIETLKGEVSELRNGKAKFAGFIGSVKNALALGADATPEVIEGKLLEMKQQNGQLVQIRTELDALKLCAEDDKKTKLIDKGVADGKLAGELLVWAKKQDSVALSAFLEVAQPIMLLGTIAAGNLPQEDSVALTAEDKISCNLLGITEEEFLAAKKLNK